MSIRQYNKNQLVKNGKPSLLIAPVTPPEHEDPLLFWTNHPKENLLVDLRIFRDGITQEEIDGKWKGAFSGRPHLISQIAPAIQATLFGTRPLTAKYYLSSLREWWRLFDSIEKEVAESGLGVARTEDVTQLTELHRERAHMMKMHRKHFEAFVSIANQVRAAKGAPILYWRSPSEEVVIRTLPPEKDLKIIRTAIKREWERALDRWILAEKMLSGERTPTNPEEERLLAHYTQYRRAQEKRGKGLLSSPEITGGASISSFSRRTGLHTLPMKQGFFPSRWDIDAAFHQCLSVTGWNPATLLAIDVTREFLVSHPRDNHRFMLSPTPDDAEGLYEVISTKARSGNLEQRIFGLWKTRFGAGFIIKRLLQQTSPLREDLVAQYRVAKQQYLKMQSSDAAKEVLTKAYNNLQRLEEGTKSLWLYFDDGDILWLSKRTRAAAYDNGKVSFLDAVIEKLNETRQKGEEIERLVASDLRDAFALWIYRASGGNILSVMKALQHRALRSTEKYLNNNILNQEVDSQFRAFTNNLFSELESGRLDPSRLAYICRHGEITSEQEERLNEYRKLPKSRIGFACRDPYTPPKHIAPDFQPNGSDVCSTQRCIMCKENAVLLPESLDGICMRIEELIATKTYVSVEAWMRSTFQEELENLLSALSLFDEEMTKKARSHWRQSIADGKHHIPGLPLHGILGDHN